MSTSPAWRWPLAVGVGARRGQDSTVVPRAVDAVLRAAGIDPARVHVLATSAARASDSGMRTAAATWRWPLVSYSAERLSGVAVPSPSSTVHRAVGTSSVAEAAALLAVAEVAEQAGRVRDRPGLIVPKTVPRPAADGVTVAVAGIATYPAGELSGDVYGRMPESGW
ncbi:cobalamin biosynthesis protein [Lipingzhangella sp. LS1_29]|uniref:Cobalamin biosynthesis protein n=1 Tax=Lipingzhangella rawalii TaxID=2055835 RepID=A0ABU2H6Z3_9ACTN|nr:cobalamin biosynthesis protein [Lipingzhangella rawalii]MDS1271076.1 cobalamin biosynthesis protein [Lipingzhangella rawalii]